MDPSNNPPTPPTPPPSPSPVPPADKTFTQADLDRIVAERLARAKVEPPADYQALKEQAEELAKLKASQLSETEKLQKAAQDAAAAAKAADDRAKAAEERAAAALRRSAIIAAATRAGAVDPDAVVTLLDPSKVTVGDDGQVTGVDEAVKALLDEKKYLVGSTPTPTPGGADGGPRGVPATAIDDMPMDQYIAARKAGTIA